MRADGHFVPPQNDGSLAMLRGKVLDWFVYLAVRVLISIIQSLRIETCEVLANGVSVLAVDVLRIRSRVVDENLALVFPQLDRQERQELSRRMWKHLILMACETAHIPRKIHRTNWHRYVDVQQKREIVRHLLDKRPTLLVSGHFGNFEAGGYVTGLLGFPTYTVARRLDNPFLDRYVNRFRSAHGQFIVPKDDSAQQIDRLLASGAALSLLGDQHAGTKGCWVDFFGRPASCHKAIALFTLTCDAPMLVVYTLRTTGPLHFQIGLAGIAEPRNLPPETNGVRSLTQWYNRKLEQLVRHDPDQYWWLHRRWKDRPQRLRNSSRAAA